MTNREKFTKTCIYDTLMQMNTRLRNNSQLRPCIMHTLFSDYFAIMERCKEHSTNCEKCVQAWLNEEAQNNAGTD